MPVHYFVQDKHLAKQGLRNYWGYNSIAYLAPHGDYAADKRPGVAVAEFRQKSPGSTGRTSTPTCSRSPGGRPPSAMPTRRSAGAAGFAAAPSTAAAARTLPGSPTKARR